LNSILLSQKNVLAALAFILAFIFSNCSTSQKSITESHRIEADSNNHTDEKLIYPDKKLALNLFITGEAAEVKGDYPTAIINYQQALNHDSSAGIFYALGKAYYVTRKLDLALINLLNAIKIDPEQKDFKNLLVDVYISANQNDSAAGILNEMILNDSTDPAPYFRLAVLYEDSKPLSAIEIYNKLTDLIGPQWNVLLRVSELYARLEKYDLAAKSIEELLTIDPSNVSIQKILADYYQRDKNYQASESILNDILESTPNDLEAREKKAILLIEQNKWIEAGEQYQYISNQPDIPLDAKLNIGANFFAKSLKDTSLHSFTKMFFESIDKDTSDWQVKMYLGAIALNEKNDSSAINYFKQTTELASWNSQGWVRLGGLYYDNAKYSEAEKVMSEAIENFPQDYAVNFILGLSLAQSNKQQEAKVYLKKSVELNPYDVNTLSAYAYTLSQLKENESAVEYLNRAIILAPTDVNLLGTLGLIYNSMGKLTESDSIYERALQIDSANALVNNNYAYSLSERDLQLERALKMVKIAVEKEPENSSYLDTIGWVYFKLGNYEEAKKYLEKGLTVSGDRAVILDHLGDVLYKLGLKEEAISNWQKAQSIDPNNENLKKKIEKGEL
jgi:tetratricopeptide (TPR) repeat protein